MLPLRPALRLSLLATALVAANLAHADVPAGALFTSEQQHLIRQLSASEVKAATPQMASAAAATVENKTRDVQTAKEVLEVGRNQLNLWLAFLGVLTGCIGLFGIAVPFFTVRNYKAETDKQADELRAKLSLTDAALAGALDAQEKAKGAQQEAEVALQQVTATQQNIATAQSAVGKAQQEAEALQTRVEVALDLARVAQEKAERHAQEIEALLHDALVKTNLIPNADEVTGALKGEVLETLKQHKPPQVVALIQQAMEKYQNKAWEAAKPLYELLSLVESHESNVWFNLGFVLSNTGADLTRVMECYQRSCLLKPSAAALYNWGCALSDHAQTLMAEEQQQCLIDACEKYADAYGLIQNDADIFCNWGIALTKLAKPLSGDEQQWRFKEASGKFEEACNLMPHDADNFYNWGVSLSEQAKVLTGSVKQQCYAEACEKYAKAEKLKPDFTDNYHNWSIALSAWARTLEGSEHEAKLAEAAVYKKKVVEMEQQAS